MLSYSRTVTILYVCSNTVCLLLEIIQLELLFYRSIDPLHRMTDTLCSCR